MTREEAIKQLEGLQRYCVHNKYSDENGSSIWGEDAQALILAIAALREQCVRDAAKTSDWISVEERLPTGFVMIDPDTNYRELEEYIVFVKGATYPTFAHFVDGEFVPPCTECNHAGAVSFADKVTHWMPLPEPPEVEV